jgi:hypothetical protein
MAQYDYLDKAPDDGTVLGNAATTKLGFYGITPGVQPLSITTTASTQITYTTSGSYSSALTTVTLTGSFGFNNLGEGMNLLKTVQNMGVALRQVEERLVTKGLIAGGTDAPTKTIYDFVGKGGDDGTILGQTAAAKVGFWGTVPCDQPGAVTAQFATLTATVSADVLTVAIPILVSNSVGYGFVDVNQAHSFVGIVANLQERIGQIVTNLTECGLLAGGTTVTTTAGYEYLTKGNDDGSIMGYSTDIKEAFWAATPCDQPAALTTWVTASNISVTVSTTTTVTVGIAVIASMASTIAVYKFADVTSAWTLVDTVKKLQVRAAEMEARLEELGIVAAN